MSLWLHGVEWNWGAVWTALMEVAVVGGLVLYEAGIAAIPGVVIIFLTQPLQVRYHFFGGSGLRVFGK